MVKGLSTKSCPRCLVCFALPGTRSGTRCKSPKGRKMSNHSRFRTETSRLQRRALVAAAGRRRHHRPDLLPAVHQLRGGGVSGSHCAPRLRKSGSSSHHASHSDTRSDQFKVESVTATKTVSHERCCLDLFPNLSFSSVPSLWCDTICAARGGGKPGVWSRCRSEELGTARKSQRLRNEPEKQVEVTH